VELDRRKREEKPKVLGQTVPAGRAKDHKTARLGCNSAPPRNYQVVMGR